MLKKTCLKIAGILLAVAVLASTITVILPTSAQATKSPPTDWFTDDFEHGNNLKALYDQSYTNNADVITTEISAESEESDNKVLRFAKTAAATGDVNVTFFPQTAEGEYALVGDETEQGIKPASGKTYRYIVEYKYRMVSISGYGIYSEVGVSERDLKNFKNSYMSYHQSTSPNTTNVGTWGEFQTLCPLGEWQTISMPATYKPGDGLSVPTVAINFKLAGNFVGEFQIDNICIKWVAEGDTTSTVIFNTNCTSPEQKYNPVTYVTGAEYTLPVPTRRGYEFIGWYSDGNFTELCDNYLPENNVNGKYSRLFARWSNTAMTDDFDQTMISESDRQLKGGFSIENGAGINGTAALKLSRSGAGEAFTVPRDLKGKLYTLETEKDKTYNYTAEITYKTSSEEAVSILFDLVENGTEKSVASAQGEIEISDVLGNNDGEWHTATVALRFKATDVNTATVAVRAKTVGAADVIIDNLNLIEIKKSFGSYKFVGDEYTGYCAPIAGVKGNRTYISTPDRDGHIFVGWADADGNVINTDAFGDTDYVLYPKWEKTSAPEGTTAVSSDNFDNSSDDRGANASSSVSGPDNSTWAVDDFERYANVGFNTADYTNWNFASDENFSLTVDTEENGNKYLHIVNKGGNMSDVRANIWFRDGDGNVVGAYKPTKFLGKYLITYKFRYKINKANTEGSYGCYMKATSVNTNTGAASQSLVFALTGGNNPGNIQYNNVFYGNNDGNWHTASLTVEMNLTRNVTFYPGWFLDICKRKVDVCLDDVSISAKYMANTYFNETNADYGKTYVNFKFKTSYTNDQNQTVAGPLFDSVTAFYGENPNLPTPLAAGKYFEGWYYNGIEISNDEPLTLLNSGQQYGTYILEARYRDRTADDPIINTFDIKLQEGAGTGKTTALAVSSSSSGNGLINLYNADLTPVSLGDLNENDKVNLIVRFRYKASALPSEGISVDFDLAEPKTVKSLSKERGTSLGVTLNGGDGNWHTVSFPVTLTRSAENPESEVTLLINFSASSALGTVYFDEFELFDAGDKELSLISFSGKVNVDPIAGVKGTKITLPESPDSAYSIGGWYTDEKMTELFGKAGESVAFGESLKLFGDFLNPYGYYATETFDNTIDIWTNQMTSRGSAFEAVWNQWGGPAGKMLDFEITDEDSYDEGGKSIKYDSEKSENKYSTVLLTDSINDQIYLGSKLDEDPATYIVSFWYKLERADSDLTVSIAGYNYNCYWEGNSRSCDPIKFTAGTKTDGWQQMTLYYQVDWSLGSAGENANNVYAGLTVSGEGVIYFDEVNYTKVNSGLAEAIYFDTDGGSLCLPVVGQQGDTISALPTPVKEGYTFEGWYTDYAYENKFTRTTFGGDGINYLFANFTKNEDKKPANDAEDESDITDTENTDISDYNNNSSGGGDISWEKRPIYEDITEEFTTTNYRTKTVITKTKISDGSGLSTLWIVLIIVAVVVVLAGVAVTVILLVKRKRSRR